MPVPNWNNRTLFESDNLPILLGMDSETVDLIATDPPFKKDKKFQGIGAAEGQKMDDTWVWHGAPPGSLNPELEYLDIDHIKPRADKGSDDMRNLCLLCPPCNRRKAHIWTLAQLRESNRRHKKIVNARRLNKKLAG